MIVTSHVTMESPRAVREILKTLAHLAGEREDYATRAATALERQGDSRGDGDHSARPVPARERLEAEARIDRSKADTARDLLTEAWLAAGYDDEGRQWISRLEAEKLTDAMITIVLAQRAAPAASRLELDDIFTGTIEVS
jgi:hypothetical protein